MPEPEPAVAIDVPPLLHVPPEDISLRVAVAPAHITAVPEMAAGAVLTVIIVLAAHPVGRL
jgi:hypothetical protein